MQFMSAAILKHIFLLPFMLPHPVNQGLHLPQSFQCIQAKYQHRFIGAIRFSHFLYWLMSLVIVLRLVQRSAHLASTTGRCSICASTSGCSVQILKLVEEALVASDSISRHGNREGRVPFILLNLPQNSLKILNCQTRDDFFFISR